MRSLVPLKAPAFVKGCDEETTGSLWDLSAALHTGRSLRPRWRRELGCSVNAEGGRQQDESWGLTTERGILSLHEGTEECFSLLA